MHIKQALVATALLALSSPAVAQSAFSGAGATTELDCDGGTATITGASNTVKVTGQCSQLVIEGAGNTVSVALAPKGMVTIIGASNVVTWTTPDDSKPRTNIQGAGNRLSQAR